MQPLGGCRASHGMEASRDTLGWVTSPCSLQAHPPWTKAGWPEPTGAQLCPALEQQGQAAGLCSLPGCGGISPPGCAGCCPRAWHSSSLALPGKGHLLSSSHGNVRELAEPRAGPGKLKQH